MQLGIPGVVGGAVSNCRKAYWHNGEEWSCTEGTQKERPHRRDTIASLTGTSLCTYAIEPPCTERYVRWCERSAENQPPTLIGKKRSAVADAGANLAKGLGGFHGVLRGVGQISQGDHATELATVLHRQAADLFPGHFFSGGGKLMSAPTVTTRPVIMWRTGTFSGFRSGATPEDDVPVCNHPADFPVFVANRQRTHIVPGQHSGGHGCWPFSRRLRMNLWVITVLYLHK